VRVYCSGLVAFQQLKPVEERGPPETWPKLSIAADCGSDVLCGISAMVHRFGLCVDFIPDTSHAANNFCWSALGFADMKPFGYLTLLALNAPLGPWSEDARWCQVRQALEELLRDEQPEASPLFMEMLPQLSQEIMAEHGWEHAKDAGAVWSHLRQSSVWGNTGKQVVRSRFLAFQQCARQLVKQWWSRAFGYTYVALELGLLNSHSLPSLKVKCDGGDPTAAPTSSKREGTGE
jgi:hypothetical protein